MNLPPYEIGNYCDYEYCDYLISMGSNVTQADYPMQTRTRYLQKFAKRTGPDAKKFKHVVVDPRFSNAAAKATHNGVGEWVPLKPASDAYFLLGMIQWIIDNNGFKKEYITLPNEKVAKEKGYRTWTDMTYLVGTGEPKTFLTGRDAGLGQSDYVVLVNGKPTMFQEATGPADLDAVAVINGKEYKTVFRLLKERVHEHTLAECETVCDIPSGTIAKIAREFTSAKHPVIEMFRGPVQQSNGWYNGQALCIVNILVDNIDRKGGYISGHAAYKGDVGKLDNARKPSGIRVDTAKAVYHGKKPLATRPWYSGYSVLRGVTPNFFSNVRMGYPYRIKAYLNYYNDPAYTMPYNQETIEALLDLKAMPLTFSIDAYMGETTSLCDYVLPDTEYLERIGGFKTYPPVKTQVWGVRQPVVGAIDPVTHDYRPIRPDTRTGDDILITLAKECGLPTFGKDGGGKGVDLNNSWQFWNEYYKHKDFSDGLDPNKPLAKMGGKFQNPAPQYQYESWPSGDYTAFHGGRKVRLLMTYQEKVATYKNAMTGTYMDGLPLYRTIVDCKEQPLDPAIYKEYPFQLHTWKEVFHTQSRTMNNLWLASIKPQNYAEINPADAERLNLQTGDWVKVKSPSSEAIESNQYPNYRKNVKQYYPNYLGGGWFKFQIRVTSRIRPGLFSVSQSYGRFGAGARKWYMGGKEQPSDARVGAGFHINPLYMADPVLKNRVLVDPVGGATQSYGTPLRVERI